MRGQAANPIGQSRCLELKWKPARRLVVRSLRADGALCLSASVSPASFSGLQLPSHAPYGLHCSTFHVVFMLQAAFACPSDAVDRFRMSGVGSTWTRNFHTNPDLNHL